MTILTAEIERFPIAGRFAIARGSKTEAVVVRATLSRDGLVGQGECVPYARYGETPEGTLAAIRALAPAIADGMSQTELQRALPPGAARNAIDCAFWDLKARIAGVDVATLTGAAWPGVIETSFTISLGSPVEMADAAAKAAHMPLLKLKLGAAGDIERLRAIRAAVPNTRLVVDANEGWRTVELPELLVACKQAGVELIEQPLPATNDGVLAAIERIVPVCADESVHGLVGLDQVAARYDAINLKLDKTGGLTEALAVADRAQSLGMEIMVGCMVSTSLSMLPAALLASRARWVDLDGPLLLAEDRVGGIRYLEGRADLSKVSLWGRPR